MAKQYNFRKYGEQFKTRIETRGYSIDVSVRKNGTRWIATCGYGTASGDTKRFAVVHLEKNLRHCVL